MKKILIVLLIFIHFIFSFKVAYAQKNDLSKQISDIGLEKHKNDVDIDNSNIFCRDIHNQLAQVRMEKYGKYNNAAAIFNLDCDQKSWGGTNCKFRKDTLENWRSRLETKYKQLLNDSENHKISLDYLMRKSIEIDSKLNSLKKEQKFEGTGSLLVVDSRSLTTKYSHDDAVTVLKKLQSQKKVFSKEMEKIQGWKEGMQKNLFEFEKIQDQAQADFLHDVLMHIPASEAFENLANIGYLSPEDAKIIGTGYDALKDAVSITEGMSSNDDTKKAEAILLAHKNIRKAMMYSAVEKLSPKAKQWLDNMGKVFDAAAQTMISSQNLSHTLPELGKLVVKCGVTLYPPADIIVAADIVGEKIGTRYSIQPAINSLQEALTQNFKAQKYLQQKLDKIEYDINAEQLTIEKYEDVHPKGN